MAGPKASSNGGYVEPTLTDLRTGRTYHELPIHDLTDGADTSISLPVPDGDWIGGFIRGHHLTIENGSLRQSLDLRPDTQFPALCAAAGREYIAGERKLLPKVTPSKPPCA
ncbi:hypothetical protein [Streptomyces sp. Ru62]|uniref:hypothetical protein n=1 Tax=Streptomyces sp. Ru62 TaxID=2080745 RepID=UPI0011B05D78|nr:hypothetical protein [Streptomyces sp. Ru62]